MKGKLRSCVAALMALCMVVGLIPATVFAAEEPETPKLKYVSLGDSMSNGYGLPGYDGNTGVEDYGHGSYANQFAEHLDAEHAQLAMSAMRAEDLHWLLEVDYEDPAVQNVIATLEANSAYYKNNTDEFDALWYSVFTNGDYWTWKELVHNYRFDVAAYCIEGKDNGGAFYTGTAYATYNDTQALEIVAAYYQDSVANADVISLGMGNGNFGVFMFGRLMEAIGFGGTPDEAMIYKVENAIRECDPATQAKILALKAELYAAVEAKIGTPVESDPTLEALANTVVYTGLSYVLNYAGSVEAILQLNPDADIILVALMNTMKTKSEVEGISLGDLMEAAFVPLNGFIAALPTYMQGVQNSVYAEADFFYAEAPYVECIVDTYDYPLTNPTVRDRFYQSIVKDEDGDAGMVWGLLGGMVTDISLAEIKAYEKMTDAQKLGYAAQNSDKAMSAGMYLAFEKAIVTGKDNAVSLESILGLTSLFEPGADPFGPVMDDFYADAAIKDDEHLDAICEFIAANSGGMLTAAQVKALIMGGEQAQAVYYALVEAQAGLPAGSVANVMADNEEGKAVLYALVEAKAGLPAGSVANVMADNEEGKAVLYALVDAQAGLPAGSVANIMAGNEQGMAVLCAIVAAQMIEAGASITPEQVAALAAANDPTIIAYIAAAKQAVVDGVATAKQTIVDGVATAKQTIIDGIATAKATVDGFNIPETAATLYMLLVMPEVLGDSVAESELAGLLALFARCIIGNGIGSHPAQGGHDSLFAAVKDAYDSKYTAADETLKNAWYLIRTYYDEAYAYGYTYAKENGYIDAAVAEIDGVIEALKALDLTDAQMTDAFRAELEAQINEAIETLEAAKALILEADVLDQASLNALLALLSEAGEDIEQLLNTLEQAAIDVNQLAIIPALKEIHKELTEEVIPAIVADLKAAVKAGTEYLLEKLGEAYDALVEALVEHIKEKAPEAADWIYNWLYNNPETVIGFFNEYGDEMLDFLAEYGDEVAMVIGYLLVNYGEEVLDYVLANGDEILVAIVKWYEVHGENTWALVKVYLDALGVTDTVNGAVSEVIETLTAEVARVKAELEAAINELKAMAEALKAQIETAVGEKKAELEALLAQVEAAIAQLEAMLAKLNAALDNLSAAIAQLEAAVAKLLSEGFAAAAAAVQAALDAVATAIEEVVAVVSEEAAAQLDAVAETLKALFNDRYLNATHGEYALVPGSYLVALGDGTAVGESYVAQLAGEFAQLRGYTYNYNNLAEEGLMIQDCYSVILDNAAEIAKANLVTLGFGSNGFNTFVSEHLMAMITGDAAELDWAAYVGEEGLPYVAEAKAKVYEEMVAAGVSGQYMGMDITDLMVAAVEAYAYSYVAYICNLPEVVNGIHAVNPEAQVVVVGMYNPLADVVLDLNGQEMEIGSYMRYLVDAANVSALTYSMITLDAIFVDVPAVEVKNSNKEMTVVNLLTEILINKSANLNPSNAGHAYITEQILNALTVTVSGLLGDADGNGVVNTLDAMMVLQYYTGIVSADEIDLSVCDLDGNGVVNTLDATLILHFYVGIIEKFPVEI